MTVPRLPDSGPQQLGMQRDGVQALLPLVGYEIYHLAGGRLAGLEARKVVLLAYFAHCITHLGFDLLPLLDQFARACNNLHFKLRVETAYAPGHHAYIGEREQDDAEQRHVRKLVYRYQSGAVYPEQGQQYGYRHEDEELAQELVKLFSESTRLR
jgi:hypothetical protein